MRLYTVYFLFKGTPSFKVDKNLFQPVETRQINLVEYVMPTENSVY
jgi:hypothetical protein